MKNSQHPKIVSVIPIRNESKIIKSLYQNIEKFVNKNPEYSFILALDNCTDGTLEILKQASNPRVVIIKGNRFNSVKPDFIGVPLKRLILSKAANKFTRILGSSYSKDLTNGFRAVNLKWFMNENFKESGFSSIMEEAYKAISGGNLILDFKTSLRYDIAIRPDSSFTFQPKILLSYAWYTVKIWGVFIQQKRKM